MKGGNGDVIRGIGFLQKTFWVVFISLITTYVFASTFNLFLFKEMNIVLNPLVQVLNSLGINIRKPFVDGPMPKEVYVNLIGIGVFGVLIYNAATITFLYLHNWTFPSTAKRAKLINEMKLNLRFIRTWSIAFSFVLFIAIFNTFFFLNSFNGWFVFHINDFVLLIFWPIVFLLLPGALVTVYWFTFLQMIVSLVMKLRNRYINHT